MISRLSFSLAALIAALISSTALGQAFDVSRAEDELRSLEGTNEVETVELMIDGQLKKIAFVTDANGLAIYQGDIVLGPAAEIRSLADQGQLSLQSLGEGNTGLFGLVATRSSTRWPEGRVPFAIDPSVPAHWHSRIRQAIRHWEEKTPIRFRELEDPSGRYVLFFDDPTTENCQTQIGRPMVGVRRVELADWCKWGNIAHEIGHVLGMHHEQARSDRALFVDLAFSAEATSSTRAQFVADPSQFTDLGPYCYDSILHYPKTNRDRSFTLTARAKPLGEWTGNPAKMGQRSALVACDIATVRTIYGFEDIADQSDVPPTGFVGTLGFEPPGCETRRKCNLVNDLTFSDRLGLVWQAPRRDPGADESVLSGTTDGASIPIWAQPLIGAPFDPRYIRPAVIHDHYTFPENRVRQWWSTQRVFYEMLKDQGVAEGTARIMYLAVLVGSRKWVQLVPGESCGPNCIRDVGEMTTVTVGPKGGIYREWAETFDTPEYDAAMRLGVAALAAYGDEMTVYDIEALAAELLPDAPVFSLGDTYAPNGVEDSLLDN
jgi:hypothetical protein